MDKDFYYKKAKENNLLARSYYKLQEINEKYKIIRNKQNVLDIGCSPGSWIQLLDKIIHSGLIIGIDILRSKIIDQYKGVKSSKGTDYLDIISGLPKNFDFYNLNNKIKIIIGDLYNFNFEIFNYKFDNIISDALPNTTGIKSVDAIKSFNLVEQELYICSQILKAKGNLISKFFQGGDINKIKKKFLEIFKKCIIYKPKASKKESKEIYLIGLDKIS